MLGTDKPQHVILLQYNIDAARREQQDSKPVEERIERLFFQNRVPGIIKTIVDSKANIATLQELRDLDSSPIKLNDFIHMVKAQTGLEVVGPAFYDKTAHSFALATFYDRKLFHVVDTGIISLHRFLTKEEDKICLWVRFECVLSGLSIIVANTHFAVSPEKLKMDSIWVLFPMLKVLKDRHECPLIVNGDFNLFDDLEGTSQRSQILERFKVKDLIHPLCMSRHSPEVLSGTFIGYPEVDAFHKTPSTMSRLDHSFFFLENSLEVSLLGEAYAVGITKEGLENADLPSDHLPCVREFELVYDDKSVYREDRPFQAPYNFFPVRVNTKPVELLPFVFPVLNDTISLPEMMPFSEPWPGAYAKK